MDWYFTARWLHILSSTVLFGTGIGTVMILSRPRKKDMALPEHSDGELNEKR